LICGAVLAASTTYGFRLSTGSFTFTDSGQFSPGEDDVKELIEAIAKALVDHPEEVQVRTVEGEQVTVLELKVHPSDLGKVIGKQGRTARSIRTILGAAGMKLKKRFTLEILE
jgi:predicted RNA-binding protein YlqC (UPF0109 family)